MKRKVFAILLASMMVFSLTACNSGAPKDQGAEAQPSGGGASGGKFAPNPAYTFYSTDEGYDAVNDPDAITFDQMRETYGPIPKWEGQFFAHGSLKSFEVEFWRVMKEGFQKFEADAKEKGKDFAMECSAAQTEEDTEGQLSLVRDQVRQGGNAIVLSAITDINCLPGMEESYEAGIPVYAIGSELPGCYGFVGSNGYMVGQRCADYMAELIDYQGQVGIVVGLTSQTATINRTNGFIDRMKEIAPDVEIVGAERSEGYHQNLADAVPRHGGHLLQCGLHDLWHRGSGGRVQQSLQRGHLYCLHRRRRRDEGLDSGRESFRHLLPGVLYHGYGSL